MVVFPPFLLKPHIHTDSPETSATLSYKYEQQPELVDEIANQIQEALKPYLDRKEQDVEVGIGKDIEHPVDGLDCLAIKVIVRVKPKKKIVRK